MKLTCDLLQQGKSSNGGYSLIQLNLLAIQYFYKGWELDVIAKQFIVTVIIQFIYLKDSYLK